MEANIITQLLTAVFTFLLGLADKYVWITVALAIVGGLYVLLTLLQPLVLAVAKWTKTDRDDAFWAKVYDFLTDYGPCFAPVAALFKKKTGWPDDAAASAGTGETDKTDAGEGK